MTTDKIAWPVQHYNYCPFTVEILLKLLVVKSQIYPIFCTGV